MTIQVRVARRHDDYVYECCRVVNGRYLLPIGCHHRIPSSANRHADQLTPPGEGIPALPVPPSGEASAMPSPGATSADRRG